MKGKTFSQVRRYVTEALNIIPERCIIEMDKDTYTLKEQFKKSVDYGIDFYAMQTVEAPAGRKIMIGWMHLPLNFKDGYTIKEKKNRIGIEHPDEDGFGYVQ